MEPLKKTTLYSFHKRNGARFVPFAGWEMPVQYSGILEEHRTVREKVGLFDVSHMGEVMVSGREAEAFLNFLVANAVSSLSVGGALYTPMCYDDGGVVDDLIIYRLEEESYLLCLNASNTESDFEWMQGPLQRFACEAKNVSREYDQLALQGPAALDVLSALKGNDFEIPKRFAFCRGKVGGAPALISHTGYTGEEGVEIYCAPADTEAIAEGLLGAGAEYGLKPCGLGARDSLRLEAGYPLYGHEISADINPLEAGLGWTVKLNKEMDFSGKEALRSEKTRGIKRRIIHFLLEGRRIARRGTPVLRGGEIVGEVVSGTHSPILNRPIGSALVSASAAEGADLYVVLRGTETRLEKKKPPLHK